MAISDLLISQLGPKGDGIHEGPRGRVYVERAIPGDRVKARVSQDEQGLLRGEIVEIAEPSPYRQEAPCPHYERCGNCSLQHTKEDFYRAWKTEIVKDAFRKQGVGPRLWLETLFIGGNNRRRATFAVYKQGHKIIMGYYRRRSKEISEIDSCLVADPKLLELRDSLKPFLVTLLKEAKPVDIFLQIVNDTIDMVITGPINLKHDTIEALMVVTGVTRVSWRPSERENMKALVTHGPVIATFGPLKVHLPPAAFLQPTPEGEKALVDAVRSALPKEGKFADLFSGCGTFSGPMLTRGPVDAYESLPEAVNALAKAAGKERLKAYRRDLFKNPLRTEEINNYDAVVFDPPRAGCPEQAVQMALAKTPTLIGVSCNPATFARDARLLSEGGYRLQSLQVVDQFLWSHHVEVVGVFTKQKR